MVLICIYHLSQPYLHRCSIEKCALITFYSAVNEVILNGII